MRLLTAAVIGLTLMWCAYWFIGAGREETALAAWFESHDRARADGFRTRGFPNRFDTEITNPTVDTGPLSWSSHFVQTMRLSYAPDHYVVVFAPEQRLLTPDGPLSLRSEQGRASAVFDDDGLVESRFTFDAPQLIADAGWSLSGARLLLATRRHDSGVKVGLDVIGMQMADAGTDLHIEGIVTLRGGHPDGTLRVTASNPDAFAQILSALAPGTGLPDRITLADGLIYLDGNPFGPAPRLP